MAGNRELLRYGIAQRRDIYRGNCPSFESFRTESNYNSQQWSRFERVRVRFYLANLSLFKLIFLSDPQLSRKVVTRRNVSKIFSVPSYFRWYGLYTENAYDTVDIHRVLRWHKSSELGLIAHIFALLFLLRMLHHRKKRFYRRSAILRVVNSMEIKNAEGIK